MTYIDSLILTGLTISTFYDALYFLGEGMKVIILTVVVLAMAGCSTPLAVQVNLQESISKQQSTITKTNWNHGSKNCKNNRDPVFDVYQHDPTTYILRQNKCLTYEAPFIYILVGKDQILVLDTGALSDKPEFSLYSKLESILGKELLSTNRLLVVHSHGHSDHYQGDMYFSGRSNVEIIRTSAKAVNQFYGFKNWPQGQKVIDLGKRQVTVIPSPGHQEEAISLYDHQTKWLLTGDTLYPGYIYVKDWQAYRKSIARLATFTDNNKVTAIMGAHIEKVDRPASYYPIGSTYQPNEARLDLAIEDLHTLNAKLKQVDEPEELNFNGFIIKPMSYFQKMLSNVSRWFTQ